MTRNRLSYLLDNEVEQLARDRNAQKMIGRAVRLDQPSSFGRSLKNDIAKRDTAQKKFRADHDLYAGCPEVDQPVSICLHSSDSSNRLQCWIKIRETCAGEQLLHLYLAFYGHLRRHNGY